MTTSTITQPFSPITQSASAYQLYSAKLSESATAVGYGFTTATDIIFDIIEASNTVTAAEAELVTATANAVDTQTTAAHTLVVGSIEASETLVGDENTLISSVVRAESVLTFSTIVPIEGVINATNSFALSRAISLVDSAVVSEGIDPGVVYNQLETAAANASDVFTIGLAETLEFSAGCFEVITPVTTSYEILSHSATAECALENTATAFEAVEYAALGSNTFSFEGSSYGEILADSVSASNWIWAKDLGAVAWVMNTQSGGLSSYDNYGFTSLAFHDGVMYATSSEGLFSLDADDDAGRNIDSLYKTGFLDFNTPNKKRISDIYIGYTGGNLECDVETYDKQVYTYGMEYREKDAPHNSRLKPGKGLASRYWRFGFRNIDGADFQIHDIAAEIGKSNRRL